MHQEKISDFHLSVVQRGSVNDEDMLVYQELNMMLTEDILHGEENLVQAHCIKDSK